MDAVRCAIEVQNAMVERNAGVPQDRRIVFRIGIHLGDVVEESDGDLMGGGVNIAARLEGGRQARRDLHLRATPSEQVNGVGSIYAVTDLGPTQLKNIAEPIRVYALEVGQPAEAKPSPFAPEKSNPPRLSIVVLPFANMGGDPEQEYFVDGITESLTTDLSRIRGSFVIGRNTAFTYKGKHVDLKQIGRELNVRYVLEGSIQRSGNRMRVNTQLIDAETGSHLWAERFDKPVAELFEMQDEIVSRLANTLGTQLITAEARRAERVPSPDSMDSYFQGMVWLNKGFIRNDLVRAQTYFERALAIDPDNVDALASNAFANVQIVVSGFAAHETAARFAAAEAAATKALSLAPDHAGAHWAVSYVFGFTNRVERAIAESETAVALDRNFAFANMALGMHKLHLDRAEETEAHVLEALRLSPRDTHLFSMLAVAGFAKDNLSRYEEAVAWQRRSIDANPNFPTSHFHLAIALAHLGRLEEARAAARVGLALAPHFTIASYLAANKFSDSPAHLAWRERQADGLRKAGLPEQ